MKSRTTIIFDNNSAVTETRSILQSVVRSKQVCVLKEVNSNSRICELQWVLISTQLGRKLCHVKVQSMARGEGGKHSAGACSYDVNKTHLWLEVPHTIPSNKSKNSSFSDISCRRTSFLYLAQNKSALSLAPSCQQSKEGGGHAVILSQEATSHQLECTSQHAFFLLGEDQLWLNKDRDWQGSAHAILVLYSLDKHGF